MQRSNETFVLSLPGKRLDVSLLVNKKRKFRTRGECDGALDAMKQMVLESWLQRNQKDPSRFVFL